MGSAIKVQFASEIYFIKNMSISAKNPKYLNNVQYITYFVHEFRKMFK